MKLRELLYVFGWKPRPRTYGFEIDEQDLGEFGKISYARWLHPKAYDHTVSPREIAELKRFIRPGDFCVDIGAHCGDTTMPMALAAGPTGCVLALEPNRYLFPVLEENSRLNREQANIKAVMAAATPEPGTYTFGYSDPGYCNGGDGRKLTRWRQRRLFPLEVTGVRLDDLLRSEYADRLDRLRYVKTDTEGNDLEVLRSIEGLLAEHRPFLRIEVFGLSSGEYRAELRELLDGLGYQVRLVNHPADLRGRELTAAGLQAIGHEDIFCVPREAASQAA